MTNQVEELKGYAQILRSDQESVSMESQSYAEIANPAAPTVEIDTGQVIGDLLGVTFELLAAKKGGHWALSGEESKIAGKAYGDVIDKYYPDAGSNLGVETTAVMITAMIFIPRIKQDAELKLLALGGDVAGDDIAVEDVSTEFKGINMKEGDKNGN